jgi:aspartate-semialdehyde dehydrogenase
MTETRPAVRIAILGALDPLGEAVMALLTERDVAVGELIPLALEETEELVSFADDDLVVGLAEGFDWRQADILVAATRHGAARRHIESAANQGCPVVCLHTALDGHAESVKRVASGLALAAAKVLAPIVRKAGLGSVDIFASLPVSLAGKAGIDELAGQTQGVFTMDDVEAEVFPVRIAFNMIPQAGILDPAGDIDTERLCASDLRLRLGLPLLPIMVTAAYAPLFFGAALSIHGVTESACDLAGMRAWLSQAPGVTVMDETVLGGVPTPYTDSQESEDVFVGRLRVDPDTGRRFGLWLVCDVTRLEAAQIVDQIENLIENAAK